MGIFSSNIIKCMCSMQCSVAHGFDNASKCHTSKQKICQFSYLTSIMIFTTCYSKMSALRDVKICKLITIIYIAF